MIISLRLKSDGLRYRYLIRWETFYQYLVNSRKVHTPSVLEGKIYFRIFQLLLVEKEKCTYMLFLICAASIPSGHLVQKLRRIDVDATPSRRVAVNTVSFSRRVHAGYALMQLLSRRRFYI